MTPPWFTFNIRHNLPHRNVPLFSGKQLDWISWKDLFLSMIHDNYGIELIDKHDYLRAYVTAESLEILRSMTSPQSCIKLHGMP